MVSNLFLGSEIKRESRKQKPVKLVTTQTAKQAEAAINKKYGNVSDTAKYYHRGNGDWVKYESETDKKNTSKNAKISKPANYSKTAHKVDVWGIDTATHKQKAPSTITIESNTRQKLIPKEKIYNGHVYVLVGTSDNTFNAKDIKKAADRKQEGTKFPKKSKIVKIQSGQYRLFGVYQEKF